MKLKFLHILLLVAITFNITHASIIALDDHCDHENGVSQHIVQIEQQSETCGDLCDFHHLFHMTAIMTATLPLHFAKHKEDPTTKLLTPQPTFNTTQNRPPIS
jgi:uncharacterized membrane protein